MHWKHSNSKCWGRDGFMVTSASGSTHHQFKAIQLPIIYNPATVLVLMAVTLYLIHYWEVLILVKRAPKSRWMSVVRERSVRPSRWWLGTSFRYLWNGCSVSCHGFLWLSLQGICVHVGPVCIPNHAAVTEGPLGSFGWKNTSWL